MQIDIYRAGRLIASVPTSTTIRDLEILRERWIAAGDIPRDAWLRIRRDARPASV